MSAREIQVGRCYDRFVYLLFPLESCQQCLFFNANLVAELLDDFVELHDFLDLRLVNYDVCSGLTHRLALRVNARLLHLVVVVSWHHRKLRVLTALIRPSRSYYRWPDLFQHSLNVSLGWLDPNGRESDLDFRQVPDDRSKLAVFDASHRFDDLELVVGVDFLWQRCLRWGVVLLVAEQNMVEERAV